MSGYLGPCLDALGCLQAGASARQAWRRRHRAAAPGHWGPRVASSRPTSGRVSEWALAGLVFAAMLCGLVVACPRPGTAKVGRISTPRSWLARFRVKPSRRSPSRRPIKGSPTCNSPWRPCRTRCRASGSSSCTLRRHSRGNPRPGTRLRRISLQLFADPSPAPAQPPQVDLVLVEPATAAGTAIVLRSRGGRALCNVLQQALDAKELASSTKTALVLFWLFPFQAGCADRWPRQVRRVQQAAADADLYAARRPAGRGGLEPDPAGRAAQWPLRMGPLRSRRKLHADRRQGGAAAGLRAVREARGHHRPAPVAVAVWRQHHLLAQSAPRRIHTRREGRLRPRGR